MVLEEWFWSCIEVGFRLDDYRYLPKFANEIPSEGDEMRLQKEQDRYVLGPVRDFKTRSDQVGPGPARKIHFLGPGN